jgi:hypothetical protein
MLGRFLRGPSADTLTLEIIGIVTGAEQLDVGRNHTLGSKKAAKYVKHLKRVIDRNRRVLDRDTLQFLRDSHQHFKGLANTPSALADGPIMTGPMPGVAAPIRVSPNPNWQEKFHQFRQEMHGPAAQVFESQYLPGFRALPAHDPSEEQKLAGRIILSLR